MIPRGVRDWFGYLIPFLEAALGLALIFGVLTCVSLICGALFTMALTIGVESSNQQWDVAGQQLLHSLVFFVLLYWIEFNDSTDSFLERRRTTQAKQILTGVFKRAVVRADPSREP